MIKKSGFLAAIAIFILLFYLFVLSPGGSSEGNKAPQFETELISGEAFSLDQLEGDYVLLDFWGSWCAPCLKEAPRLVDLNNKFKSVKFSDADGFTIVSIALEKNDRNWKRTSERLGFDWKHQIVEQSKFVMMSKLAQKYSVSDIPAKFLISPDGKILMSNPSVPELDSFLVSKSL